MHDLLRSRNLQQQNYMIILRAERRFVSSKTRDLDQLRRVVNHLRVTGARLPRASLRALPLFYFAISPGFIPQPLDAAAASVSKLLTQDASWMALKALGELPLLQHVGDTCGEEIWQRVWCWYKALEGYYLEADETKPLPDSDVKWVDLIHTFTLIMARLCVSDSGRRIVVATPDVYPMIIRAWRHAQTLAEDHKLRATAHYTDSSLVPIRLRAQELINGVGGSELGLAHIVRLHLKEYRAQFCDTTVLGKSVIGVVYVVHFLELFDPFFGGPQGAEETPFSKALIADGLAPLLCDMLHRLAHVTLKHPSWYDLQDPLVHTEVVVPILRLLGVILRAKPTLDTLISALSHRLIQSLIRLSSNPLTQQHTGTELYTVIAPFFAKLLPRALKDAGVLPTVQRTLPEVAVLITTRSFRHGTLYGPWMHTQALLERLLGFVPPVIVEEPMLGSYSGMAPSDFAALPAPLPRAVMPGALPLSDVEEQALMPHPSSRTSPMEWLKRLIGMFLRC
uniref:Pre-rRNA-processing protein RIX1 n=1 Tax=Mycena chlorophos TaxID=658473 RepID=A0ABQ0M0S2_MYCCL|nr:predicted protein [Mycena chlorophos]